MGGGGGKGMDADSINTKAEVTPVAPASPTPRNAEAAQKAADDERERLRKAMNSEKLLLSRGSLGTITGNVANTGGSKTLGA